MGAQTSQFWSSEVSCLLRFTPATNLRAHALQFGSGDLILYWSRIRNTVTQPKRTYIQRTEKAITEATLIPWTAGLSGPIKHI